MSRGVQPTAAAPAGAPQHGATPPPAAVGQLQRRIRLLCGAWFLAGAALAAGVGSWLGGAEPAPLPGAAQEAFVQRFADDYKLDRDQRRLLRMVIRAQEAERVEALRQAESLLPEGVRDRLAAVDRQTDRRIRALLRPDQLARYTGSGADPAATR